MSCITSNLCGHFQCLLNEMCVHISPTTPNIFWLTSVLIIFPSAVGFASASSFGNAAIIIFMFMLVLNYGRKDSSSLAQPMSTGIFIANTMNNISKTHPVLHTSLIDYNLALMILPNMISGLVAGIHFKAYVPSLFLTIFFVFQLGVLIMNTQKKHKQLEQFQLAQRKVNIDTDTKKESAQLISDNLLSLDDQIHIDFDRIFTLIAQSPNRELYLKHLPLELQNLDLTKGDNQISVKEFCKQKYEPKQIQDFGEKLVEDKKLQDQQNMTKLVMIVGIAVFNLLFMFSTQLRNHDPTLISGCQGNYWSVFQIQFLINLVIYLCYMRSQYPLKVVVKLFVVSFIGGFCLGLVGMGVAIFLVVAIGKMKICKGGLQSIGATLPLLFGVVTATGSVILIITGAIDVFSTLLFGVLGFVGQKQFNPIIAGELKKRNLTTKLTKAAVIFQKLLVVLYLGLQAPKMIKTPFLEQVTPHPYCHN